MHPSQIHLPLMVIACVIIGGFLMLSMRGRSLIPNRMQSVAEISYQFVASMVRDNVGTAGMKFFPFVFTLFSFVLVCNMLGMVPFAFTVTRSYHCDICSRITCYECCHYLRFLEKWYWLLEVICTECTILAIANTYPY